MDTTTADPTLDDDAPLTERMSLKIVLILGSIMGLLASSMLVLEKINFWTNKAKGLSTDSACSINPIVGCGNVINTPEASIFWDIPNPLIGVIGFSMLLLASVFIASNLTLKDWHWGGIQIGVIFGISIVSWLQWQTIFDLHALCPYCMVTWAAMIPVFWVVTARNLRTYLPGSKIAAIVSDWTLLWTLLHFIVIMATIWFVFGSAIFASS